MSEKSLNDFTGGRSLSSKSSSPDKSGDSITITHMQSSGIEPGLGASILTKEPDQHINDKE